MTERTLTVRLRAITTQYNASMASAGRATAGLATSVETSMAKASGSTQAMATKLGGLKSNLGALAATGIGVGLVASLDSAGDAFAKAGRETLKFKRITGATAEDSSRLRVVAQQTGTDVTKLAAAFVKLSKTQDTAKGQAALDALGVSLKDANGKALPLPEQLQRIADGFKHTGDAATRNRAVVDLFGKSGADLGPLLSRGADGIDALIKKSDELGLTLGEDDLESVKKYTQAQRDMSAAWEGFQIQVGSSVLPVLADGLAATAEGAGRTAAAFAKLPEPLKNGAVGLAGISGAALALFGGGGLMLRGLSSATAGWKSFAGGVGQARGALASLNLRDEAGNLTRLGIAARAAAAAGTALAVGFALDQLGKSDTKEYFDALASTSESATKDVLANLGAAGQATKGFSDTLFELSPAIINFADGTGTSLSNVDRALGDAYKSNNLDGLRKGITALKDAAKDPINAPIREEILAVVDDYQRKLDVTSAAQEKTGDTAAAAAEQVTSLEEVMRLVDAKVGDLTSTFQANQAAAKGWADGIAQSGGIWNDATDAAQGLGHAWNGLREVAGELPKTIDIAAISQGKYTEEQNKAIDGWQQLGAAIQTQLQTQLQVGASTDQVRASAAMYEQQLRSQLDTMGITDAAAQNYYLTLAGLDGTSVETAITLSGAELARQQLQILQGNFDNLPPEKRSEIYAKIAQNDWVGAKAVYDSLQSKTVQLELQTKYTSWGVTAEATAKRQGRIPGEVYRRAAGGVIPFQSAGTDTVPAMLTPGEFVLRKSAVDRLGVAYLDRLNRGTPPAKFNQGGLVSGQTRAMLTPAVAPGTYTAAGPAGGSSSPSAELVGMLAQVAGDLKAARPLLGDVHYHGLDDAPGPAQLARDAKFVKALVS